MRSELLLFQNFVLHATDPEAQDPTIAFGVSNKCICVCTGEDEDGKKVQQTDRDSSITREECEAANGAECIVSRIFSDVAGRYACNYYTKIGAGINQASE